MKLFISPHNDDEALFGAFTLLRERPVVLVVFDSFVQPSRGIYGTDWMMRRDETRKACDILGVKYLFMGCRDDDPPPVNVIRSYINALMPTRIWAPAHEQDGHDQHNLVAAACDTFYGTTRYLTYTRTKGKSVNNNPVLIHDPSWIGKKLMALSCYESQFQPATGCAPHFLRGIEEFYA